MISNIKAIVFDLDDTLLNSKQSQYNAICEFKNMFEEFKGVSDDEFTKKWNKFTMKTYDKYHKGIISFRDLKAERMKTLFQNYNIQIDNEAAIKNFNLYSKIYEKEWILFDDTIDVLESLKEKHKLAILTNGDSTFQRRKINKTGIGKYFNEIIISDEVGVAKPNKKIFEYVCNELHVKIKECIMIGDKFKVDIQGALNAGMNAIWLDRRNENIEYKYKAKELSQILEFIENM